MKVETKDWTSGEMGAGCNITYDLTEECNALYAAGFRAGLEAAAMFVKNEQVDNDDYSERFINRILALSPSPSATEQTKTDALPRPEPEPK